MLKRQLKTVAAIAAMMLAGHAIADAPTITGVTARQKRPWDKKVDITFTVTGNVAEQGPAALSVSAADRENGKSYVADATALSGDTGTAAGLHHVVWDLEAQGLAFKSDEMVFTVAYVEKQLYCVIDLSAGANASSYPVTYLDEPPSGGFNTDEYKTTKLVFRLIKPGTFMMRGSYQTTLTKAFYCGVFEVTQKQYQLITGSNPSIRTGDMRPVETVSYNAIRGSSLGAQWPASSSVDANSFMGKLRARTGLDFDLPTEAQWEYACRAGTTSAYNNGGDTEDDLRTLGRYSGNRGDGKGGYSQHTTVGSYLPNAWGLFDMHGNVREWCLDWYSLTLADGTDPKGSSSESRRVLSGGDWGYAAGSCASSSKSSLSPSHTSYYDGFRLVRTLSE